MAAFQKKDPRQGADSDEETARAAERAIQDGFAKKKGVYKSLSAARLLGKVSQNLRSIPQGSVFLSEFLSNRSINMLLL